MYMINLLMYELFAGDKHQTPIEQCPNKVPNLMFICQVGSMDDPKFLA